MEKYQVIQQDSWPRKQQFDFYRNFQQPFFSLIFNLDAKSLFEKCKENRISFFHAYSHSLMKVINSNEPFRLRIVEDEVRDYQQIDLANTVLADDGCIRFSYIEYDQDFNRFVSNITEANKLAQSREFMHEDFAKLQQRFNVVYMSVVPWVNFTSYKHAFSGEDDPGIPRIAIGKMNSQFEMPVSIDLHHSLADGIHVGIFAEQLQKCFDSFTA